MRIRATRVGERMREAISRRVIVFAFIAGLFTLETNAQEPRDYSQRQFPRTEISLDLSYIGLSAGSQSAFVGQRHYWGVKLDPKINLSKHFGLLFDFARQDNACSYGDPACFVTHIEVQNAQFLVGPEFTLRSHRFSAFVHTLAGASRIAVTEQIPSVWGPGGEVTPSKTADLGRRTTLAFGAGGGIDLNLGRTFALRPLQGDYIPSRLDAKWQGRVRLSSGLVVRF